MMVLMDPRASHNFINAGFTDKKNIKKKGFEGSKVSNTSQKLILVDQIMKRFGERLQSCKMKEEFYIYHLKEHPHIILGV